MRFHRLHDWLRWQETLHVRAIDPGLERIRVVAETLGLERPGVPVLTVAGTNGKGSCVAYADSILRAAGYRTGAYTSPHLLRYNERIRIDGAEAADEALVAAFDAIDRARGEITLSYFEFSTLAALLLFREAGVDVCLLEVGLGGRLDAVNLVDADVALVTSIGMDHADWLGDDLNAIAREKAGVFRPCRPAVFAGDVMPPAIAEVAGVTGARLLQAGRDYRWMAEADGHWRLEAAGQDHGRLPQPAIQGRAQIANAAGVLVALAQLDDRLPVSTEAVCRGLESAVLPGRLQRLPGPVEWLLDVAHNADSAAVLAEALRLDGPPGRRYGVLGLMRRKDPEAVLGPLAGLMDGWFLLELPDADSWSPAELEAWLPAGTVLRAGTAEQLLPAIAATAVGGDQVVVFGSFRTVEEMWRRRVASDAA